MSVVVPNGCTPAPWTCCLGSGNVLMTGVAHRREDGTTEFVADCLPDYALAEPRRAPENHVPNMRLVSASPDLYASVVELYQTLLDGMTADYDEMCAQLGRARAAIAKAEGREP